MAPSLKPVAPGSDKQTSNENETCRKISQRRSSPRGASGYHAGDRTRTPLPERFAIINTLYNFFLTQVLYAMSNQVLKIFPSTPGIFFPHEREILADLSVNTLTRFRNNHTIKE